mmetsp:Transcript_6857/g.10109  ORF Transcript_6857/g.10109 Transcript_6857/m.10109 type:complete len:190 (-) Transcript_6857:30-599(-)
MELIDFQDPNLYTALLAIALNPIYWNLAAQLEYRTKLISKFFTKERVACSALGVTILLLNYVRTNAFHTAVSSQPKMEADSALVSLVCYGLVVLGQVFVITSFYKLGWYGTFLGDYFGIFDLDGPVTSFPFNVTSDPMYWGSTITYLGYAILERSFAGLILTGWLALVYSLAIALEGPMLRQLYSKKSN